MIQVTNVSKVYNDRDILKDVSFKLKKGKTTAILGHNGAGKTTLIKCLLKLTKYDGKIDYDFAEDELYKHINVQMQTSNYEPNATVKDICNLYQEILDADVEMDKLLKTFGLETFKKQQANKLSGGEKQKLSILLTVINKPKVIFYDEITTGLDVIARRQVWKLLKKLQKESDLTILITSHMLEEIEYLADELIILEKGEIKLIGTVESFINEMYGNLKQIKFKTVDASLVDQLTKVHKSLVQLADNAFSFEVADVDEQKIINDLYALGIKDIEFSSYSFEDAFMKRFGYTINVEGGADYERNADFF